MCDGNEYDVILLKMNTVILAKHVVAVNMWHAFSAVHYLLNLSAIVNHAYLLRYGEFPIVKSFSSRVKDRNVLFQLPLQLTHWDDVA